MNHVTYKNMHTHPRDWSNIIYPLVLFLNERVFKNFAFFSNPSAYFNTHFYAVAEFLCRVNAGANET